MIASITPKKHKKHRRERLMEAEGFYDHQTPEKPAGLKLILKVGANSNSHQEFNGAYSNMLSHNQYQQSQMGGFNYSISPGDPEFDRYHKKLKKKKKKKDKRHKHHHKDKKRRREESSQDSVGDDESAAAAHQEPPKKIIAINHQSMPVRSPPPGESRPMSSGLSPHREPRTCVLRKIAERTPLQRLLEHLLRSMEKRDPQQFFAWPVTDNIAPNYSQIITNPMDFSTIKQKIDDNNYQCVADFVEDFKLMCTNAMTYNHSDTIYYKAAKKLLHVGLKMVQQDKLKQMRPALTYMQDLTKEELGFELEKVEPSQLVDNVVVEEEKFEKDQDEKPDELVNNVQQVSVKKESHKKSRTYLEKFEAVPDDMTPEEILQQAQNAAKSAADKLSLKRATSKMGFLRQKKDGSTSLQIIVPGDGVIPGTNQRPVSLGQLIGKLSHGTGSLAGFRDDRRNMSKPVKPLYYGAFGSYAPSYDSTFANLTKEESDLVYQTYGDETAVQYAESILDFAKDCDYTLTMVDDLLDILTNGEHRKTKDLLDEKRRLKEEEEKIKHLLEKPAQDINSNISTTADKIKVDVDQLKTLSDLGIDVDFLEPIEEELKLSDQQTVLQTRLDETSQLINNLRQTQHCRLSAPPPQHLANVPKASENEVALAEKITESLTDIAKKLPPSVIAPVEGLRRAMGISPMGGPEPMEVEPITHNPTIVTDGNVIQQENSDPVVAQDIDEATSQVLDEAATMQMSLDVSSERQEQMQMSGVNDLESELREFLESDPTLGHSPLHDDKTLEDILSES